MTVNLRKSGQCLLEFDELFSDSGTLSRQDDVYTSAAVNSRKSWNTLTILRSKTLRNRLASHLRKCAAESSAFDMRSNHCEKFSAGFDSSTKLTALQLSSKKASTASCFGIKLM